MSSSGLNKPQLTLGRKLWQIHWLFVILVCVIATIGFAMLYSAANGSFDPWTTRQLMRFSAAVILMLVVAVIDIRLWLRYSYVIYFVILAMLAAVEYGGAIGMGAQRWIDLGFINVQPSELMKIALVLALARYFHGCRMEDVGRPLYLLVPIMLMAAPVTLVIRQPDLGTAVMLIIAGATLFYLAGVRIWVFVSVAVTGLLAAPVIWQLLRDYQRQRVLTFLDPENDPLGGGYHIIQSKIALGSGGLFGKGFMQGTQGNLNFLPEKQTDFIFTMLAEEFGLAGGLTLLGLYVLLMAYGLAISLRCQNQFGRLVGMGVTTTFFLYFFINMAMVMGLIPVVGVPLPLISYGGTAMLTLMFGFGLLLGVYVHRDDRLSRRGVGEGI